MNICELQQFLRALGQPLNTCGGTKISADLERACCALEPFKSLSVAQFADFLQRAAEFDRTGVVSAAGKAKATARSAKKGDPEAIRAAADRLRALYDRVASPEVTYAAIEAEAKRLDKDFQKDAVVEIARAMGIAGNLKSKKAAIEEIQRRMTDRKESAERTAFS